MEPNKKQNFQLVIPLIQAIKNSFITSGDCFERHSDNTSKLNSISIAYDTSTGSIRYFNRRRLAMIAIIIIDAFFSKSVAFYFLHIKAGIPFDSLSYMWAIDFLLAIPFSFGIIFLSVIAVEMGLRIYRDIARSSVPYYILGFALLLVIPIVNIRMKSSDSNFDFVLNGILPVIAFIFSCFCVYIYADASIKYKEKDAQLIMAVKEKRQLINNEEKVRITAKNSKQSIEENVTKLGIFLNDFEKDELAKLLMPFKKNERYILDRYLSHLSPAGLTISLTGAMEDLSQDPFVLYYDSI